MKVYSFIPDHRIEASNVLVEMSIEAYISFSEFILSNNDYQRKKVIKSNLQETLRSDLLRGCTIPAIVLAVKKEEIVHGFNYEEFSDQKYITDIINKKEILILDGLQRTYVILDLYSDYKAGKLTEADVQLFLKQTIRAELYVGLSKLGILYRMLTLNTGQTTMSTRHLMEILYLDYLNEDIDGIKLIRDIESAPVSTGTAEYKFQDVLDGYYSFIENTEIPLERADILNTVQTIKSLDKTNEEKDGFVEFIKTFRLILDKFDKLSDSFEYSEEEFSAHEYRLEGPPFGKNAIIMFKKSQCFTGFGAALHFLKFRRGLDFKNISEFISDIKITSGSGKEIFKIINKQFDYIRNRSKKVGNDQRFYFKVFFQQLLDPESESFTSFDGAVENAYRRVKEKIESI